VRVEPLALDLRSYRDEWRGEVERMEKAS
jgi:hypothetical protein